MFIWTLQISGSNFVASVDIDVTIGEQNKEVHSKMNDYSKVASRHRHQILAYIKLHTRC